MIAKSLKPLANLFTPQKDNSLPLSNVFRQIFELPWLKSIIGLGLLTIGFLTLFLNSPRPVLGGQEAVLPSPDPQQIQTQTTFKLPLTAGYISQKYTWYHQGVDITGPLKTPIYPIAEGQVKEVSFSKLGYGHSIIIEHENSFESLYAHLGEIKVRQGDKVAKETVIGVVGMTGFTTGPHLHLEVRKQNSLLDPLTVLPDFKLSKETGGQ